MYSLSAVVLLIVLSVNPLRASDSCKVENTTAICEGFIDVEDADIERIVVKGIVDYIGKENFTTFENLKSIDLSNTGLREIENDTFISNEHLEELNLSQNQDLLILPNETFISSKSLKYLNLSQTAIEQITDNVVSELPNLEVIDVSQTTIKIFTSLSNLKKLKTLIISDKTNKDLLCDEIHLREIIEVENDKRITYNCTQKPKNITVEQEHATVNETTNAETTKVETTKEETKEETAKEETTKEETTKEETTKEETTKEETTVEKTTEETAASVETTTITENPQTEVNTETTSENKPEQPEPVVPVEKTDSKTEIPETTPENLVVPLENMQSAENPLPPKIPEIPETQPPEINSENTNETSQPEEPSERKLDTYENSKNQTKVSENLVRGVENAENSEVERNAAEAEAVQPSPSQSSGVNIVLGIILCVMIVGALGFGYKYWKKHRQGYRNANTEDVELGKEMQDMRLCSEEQN